MNSDTSTDKDDFNIYDKYGNDVPIPPLKKETSETDMYFGLLANPSKSKLDTEKSTSSLHFDNDKNNKDTDTSSVRNSYKNIAKDKDKKTSIKHNSYSHSDRDSFKSRDSRDSSSSDSSKARYEDVRLSDKSSKTDISQDEKKPVLTGQQLRMKKIEMLRKLCDLKTKGYKLSKEYDFNSSIEEMEYEYDLLKSFADRRNGIKLYKSTIININILEVR